MSDEEINDDDPSLEVIGGIVGNAVSMVPSGIWARVFGQSADIVGEELGHITETWANKRKARKAKNIDDHFQVIEGNLPRKNEELTEVNEAQFEEWAETASDIREDDVEAPIWQGILLNILKGESADKLILLARQLSEQDIQTIKRYGSVRRFNNRRVFGALTPTFNAWMDIEPFNLYNLISVGALRNHALLPISPIIKFAFVALSLSSMAFMLVTPNVIEAPLITQVTALATFLVSSFLYLLSLMRITVFTSIGDEIYKFLSEIA